MSPKDLLEPIHILLVDDDPADVRLTLEALKEHKVHGQTAVAPDGVEALAYLRREGPYVDVARPDIILLDLNMPRQDGREVLREIKADSSLKRILVVIMATSNADQDVLQSYDLGANCYMVKPVDLDQLSTIVKAIEEFWFTVVKVPPR
ncbi:MAG TPA: response regulator [Candidatus Tectomicrobia bacterium]